MFSQVLGFQGAGSFSKVPCIPNASGRHYRADEVGLLSARTGAWAARW
jgi:hypothetical protein